MKFTDGFWRNKDGVDVYNAAEAFEIERGERSLTVTAPHFNVENRGQTLWGPVLGFRFSSPAEGIIRVQMEHFRGRRRKFPSFRLSESGDIPVSIGETEDYAELSSGGLSVRIGRGKQWAVDFLQDGRVITNSGRKNAGYVLDARKQPYVKEQLALGVGECVYGLGERFTALVRNGQTVEIWNEDGGTSSDQSYKTVPFYLSNRGYGVFVNDTGPVSFEVASEKVSRVQFSVPGEYLEYCVIGGPTPKDVLRRYTSLTGKPALPPAWSFGLWLTTSFVTTYDEKTVTSFIEGMKERDIPLSVFHFDCFWMKEYRWTDFSWDSRQFPDPEGFLKRLKARGLKICVWINPYIAQKSRLFDEGMEKGYLLKRPDGDVWQTDSWQPGMGIVDFTNPGACEWYSSHLRRLVRMGVDCFKTDFGERIPTDVVWSDGSDPERMHNFYTYLYNETVFAALERELGAGNSLVFARSATAGGQKFPVHWGGDSTANYESMAESLRGGLSLGLSGFGFWSHDISGFEHTATPDLYKRWSAFGLLSSHSRLHGNASYRVPWLFDEESVEVLRHFAKLKCSIMPYLFAQSAQCARDGLPLMRAMMLEYPSDPACTYLDRQYMLGSSLLVAPVFSPDGQVEFYLPEGIWFDFPTGKACRGATWMRERHGYFSLPLLVREGSLIATGGRNDRPDYDYADAVVLRLYGLADGAGTSASVFSPEGKVDLTVTVNRTGSTLNVKASGAGKPWSLRLHGFGETLKDDTEIKPSSYTGTFSVPLRGSGK